MLVNGKLKCFCIFKLQGWINGIINFFVCVFRYLDVVFIIKNKEMMWWLWEWYSEFFVMWGYSRSFFLL